MPPGPSTAPPLLIDGSRGEGGGQVLRAAVALCGLLGRDASIFSIRAGRARPGLAAQHLASARAVAAVAGLELDGAELGSTALGVRASSARWRTRGAGLHFREVRTAGSTALVLQALLPCLLRFVRAGERATVSGGTVARLAPQFDFLREVFCANLRLLGVGVEVVAESHGFFPRGGGLLGVTWRKEGGADGRCVLRAVDLTRRGVFEAVRGRVLVAGKVGDEDGAAVARGAKRVLRRRLGLTSECVNVCVERVPPEQCLQGTVCAVTLWSEMVEAETGERLSTFGASALLERRGSPEGVGEAAAEELCDAIESGACLDSHMADQIVLLLAMAAGTSKVLIAEPTLHTRTVVDIVQQFGVDCKLEPTNNADSVGKTYLLTCVGLALELEP